MSEWEKVLDDALHSVHRCKVEGGWLYRWGTAMEFVPAAADKGRMAPTQAQHEAFPTVRRGAPPRRPAGEEIIDAEFEEVPVHEVNGSEVITLTRID